MSRIIEIKVPDIGDVTDAEIIEIPVALGDAVEKEDTLIVLETDKATMDVPSPHTGTIKQLVAKLGDKVSQDSIILLLEQTEPTLESDDNLTEDVAKISAESEQIKEKDQQQTTPVEVVQQKAPTTYPSGKALVYASPAVRRFARELGADLTNVKGSGSKGRIIKEDVQKFVKAQITRVSTATQSSTSMMPTMPVIDFSKFGEIESIPLSRIQKISSSHLQRNWVSIPHVTQHDEADITELEAFRVSMKEEAANQGIKLTPLAFMMKAVVASLKAYPRFNASLAVDGENLVLKKYFHIGVAVDTADGLVVPVVRDVDKKSVYQLASEVVELSVKAREKKLGIDGMQGSSFTISSLGGIGGTAFTPIVNWPDVAILGVSKSRNKPIWDGDNFIPRLMLPLSLSYDHRVIDGALAARFITHLSTTLGDIRRLVL